MIELLAPGGSEAKMRTAFEYGADAVYLGGEAFGLRANAENFTLQQIADAAAFAERRGKKIYVTMNIFARNGDLKEMARYAAALSQTKAHGVIVSDPGAFLTVREAAPELPLHVSTQANTLNWRTCEFWKKMGAVRVNLARELTLSEIAEISAALRERDCRLELEAFVHGAMCMSYSGRCMLSDYLASRSSNRGDCAQPCRWYYKITEENRPGEPLQAEETERGTFLFNSKDLCMLPYLQELKDAGITSFKIEGRMKSEFYTAITVRAYRLAIDAMECGRPLRPGEPETEALMEEVCSVSHRDYSPGFYLGERGSQIYETSSYRRTADFIGTVDSCEADGAAYRTVITQRGAFSEGDLLEFVQPDGPVQAHRLGRMYNAAGERIARAPHAMMKVTTKLPFPVKPGCVIRRRKATEYRKE